jgi:hypothetical protein
MGVYSMIFLVDILSLRCPLLWPHSILALSVRQSARMEALRLLVGRTVAHNTDPASVGERDQRYLGGMCCLHYEPKISKRCTCAYPRITYSTIDGESTLDIGFRFTEPITRSPPIWRMRLSRSYNLDSTQPSMGATFRNLLDGGGLMHEALFCSGLGRTSHAIMHEASDSLLFTTRVVIGTHDVQIWLLAVD